MLGLLYPHWYTLTTSTYLDVGLTGRAAKNMQMNTLSAALLAGSLLEEEVSQEELLVSHRRTL